LKNSRAPSVSNGQSFSRPSLVIRTVPVIRGGGGLMSPAYTASYSVAYYSTKQTSEPIGIIEGSPGVLYSQASGSAIYSVTKQGTAIILASFSDPPYVIGSAPGSMAANALLYSSVGQVGSGSIFSVGSTAGTETTYPTSTLSLIPVAGNLPNGNLFGLAGNYSNNSYNLATIDLRGNVTPFYQFPSTDRPSPPIYAEDGNYYGVSQPAVSGATAYLYRVTPSGSFTNVATLPFVKTAFAGGGLVLEGSDGNFYGIQSTGLGCSKTNPHGAVYKLTPAGQYTILHDFGVCGNGVVNSLIEGSDGKLYGAIQGDGVLFSLTKSGTYKVEFRPTNGSTQGLCTCILVQGSDGIIYGTAVGGGPQGLGVIFALNASLPVPKPKAREFSPSSGPTGTQVMIWGQNLLGASVQFNGAGATTVSNAGPNYVWAAVPPGATSGPVTVTTPGGTSITHSRFKVN
jgi:uncharacterized repeat protein (TIGR03803 family)